MNSRWVRELFSFSRKERIGILVLLSVIFGLILIGKLIPAFIPSDKTNFSNWEREVNTYLAKEENKISGIKTLHVEPFNPNTVDSGSLTTMGLPLKVVSNWMRYLEKGGRFRDKEGIKKIFGMTPELFEQLDSFIQIPARPLIKIKEGGVTPLVNSPKNFNSDTIAGLKSAINEKNSAMVIELNSTDSLHLLEIPGIGSILASRIIRYRNLLGGYYSVSQLKEVYNLREENFKAASPHFTADQSTIKTFNINFSTIQELGRHPYIGYKTARMMLKLRDKMGKFSSREDLLSVVSPDSLTRLIPYVKFSQ